MAPEWSWLRKAREHELALAARLMGSSCAGPHLDRLTREAPLRCPGCGGTGHWIGWAGTGSSGTGIGQTVEQRARAVRDTLEAGESLTGTDIGDRPMVAAGDDVWLCSRCGHWTAEPMAVLTEERADDLSVLPGHRAATGGGRDADGRLLAYVEGRLALLEAEDASDYLDALTGGVVDGLESMWIEVMDQRRCRNAEDAEETNRPARP